DHLDDDWSRLTIVTDGDGVYACTSDSEVVDLLRSGQGVLGAIVAVGKVREQLAGDLRELRPVPSEVQYGKGEGKGSITAKEG
ncbi:MAG: hypothetical protein ACRDJ5_05045, partial [Actinomycetota bacterium]